ncbi:MAG: hypothetical protein AAF752_02440, partial [Bacteroidota bacterium]
MLSGLRAPRWARPVGLLVVGFVLAAPVYALQAEESPPMLRRLNVKDADLRDVFRSMGHEYGLNMVVDNRIDQRVTFRLGDVPVEDALNFLCKEYRLQCEWNGSIIRVMPPLVEPPPPPEPLAISFSEAGLHIDVQAEPVAEVMRLVQEVSGSNIVLQQGLTGTVTANLKDVPLTLALKTIAESNGFMLRERDGLYHLALDPTLAAQQAANRRLWVEVEGETISLDVSEVPITQVLDRIKADMPSVSIIAYEPPQGTISARTSKLTLEETLDVLLSGSEFTYRLNGSMYAIGRKSSAGLTESAMLKIEHLRADSTLSLLPGTLKEGLTIQVVKEHNALMVIGPVDVIRQVSRYIDTVDHPTPQILIETLVVDVQSTDLFDLGLTFGRDPERAGTDDAARARYGFNTDEEGNGGLSFTANGDRIDKARTGGLLGDLLGVRRIGRLPSDFFVQINALDQDGRLDVRSRPQVATLNGHKANISIGTTQYYLLRSSTFPNYGNGGFRGQGTDDDIPFLAQSQRFERIEANVKLEITPWVNENGHVTVDIRPEFSAPVGEFNPDVPPTISSRVLESTVRLRDGETIVLGGLIEEREDVVQTKIPILGSIPLLGRLFRSERKETRKSELVIFLTPHVFYGDGQDNERWGTYREGLDLSFDQPNRMGYTEVEK